MCFSATASITVGAGLLGPGYYALKRSSFRGMLLFASTPLLFSFHQLTEGFLWLSLKNPEFASWYTPTLYVYSFVSQPLWPIWVPLIMWLMEPDKRRKKILFYFLLLGSAASLYSLYCLINYDISAFIENGHIRYNIDHPYRDLLLPVRFVTMAVTPFLSTLRYTKLLAVGMMVSLILTYFFFTNYLISVWCFFAAILSLLVILVVINNKVSVK